MEIMPKDEKETVIFIDEIIYNNYLLPIIDKMNKRKVSPFFYKLYSMPIINEDTIDDCIRYVKDEGKDCVLSLRDGFTRVCATVNERLGYASPTLSSIVACTDKFRTRMLVKDFDWFYGFNLDFPIDQVVENIKTFPCMLKPTKLCSGVGAFRCNSEAIFRSKLQGVISDTSIRNRIQALQNEMATIPGDNYQYLVEEFIETADKDVYQLYVEVFVTRDGNIIPYSISEQVVFEDGMFAGYVMPPIHFDADIHLYEEYAIHIGKLLYSVGFKNQGFNFEFWRFPNGKFRLVEINPRISTPSSDLHEQYSGNILFDDLTRLFLHNKRPTHTPFSVLKDRLSTNTHREEYVMMIEFSTRALGVVSSIVNYDLLEDLSGKGPVVLFYTVRDYVITEVDATNLGKLISYVTIKGTWNEIVKTEKSLREQFHMSLPQYADCFKYPKYFDPNYFTEQ